MAFREVTMIEIKEVLRQWLAGVATKRIAARVGLDPKTVRRYLHAAEAYGLSPGSAEGALTEEALTAVVAKLAGAPEREHGEAWRQCAFYRAFIEEKLGERVRLEQERIPYGWVQRALGE